MSSNYSNDQVEALWKEYDANGINIVCPNCRVEDGMEVTEKPPSLAGLYGQFVVRCTNCGSSGSQVIKNLRRKG